MADFSDLKLQIAAAIRANGEGAITGDLLQEQLLDMVDAMEIETFGGLISDETTSPSDTTKPHIFLAVTAGEYEAFDLSVEEGDVWLVARAAGETEWTKTNLTAPLVSAIEEIGTGKQDALTEGDGIDIDENNVISVKNGSGLDYDDEGNLIVDTTDTPATDTTKPVSGQGVVDYIDGQKGAANGIAPLDADGLVDKTDLPTDTIYYETTTDPSSEEYVDEYQRILANLYQAIDDVLELNTAMSAAKDSATSAAESATTAAATANTAANSATESATLAQTATNTANTAANNATAAAESAYAAASQTQTAVNAATAAAATASSAASDANDAAEAATAAATYANEKGDYADTKGDYADEQGDYAKEQGDYAKDQIDNAKGDFDSLDARMQHIDEISVTLDETTDPTDEEYQDEYQRVLAVLYQAIDDVEEISEDAEEATAAANTATTNATAATTAANTAIDAANTATSSANDAADYANEQGDYAKAQGDYATEQIVAAKGGYDTLAARLTDMASKEYSFEENSNPASLLS